MTDSVDLDQMPHFVASDLGLHCLLRPVCHIFLVCSHTKCYNEEIRKIFI